ncbi:chaperone modulator CbpM [Dysgonomonas sp. 511]|uniref:chaperone modulator CbpM n=1 Tax=Dysgonomonas sp. 511 TaxID=2302930 RepID=UPI0013D08946|nr:chaperone modulator CbpM [Dysgonomonas sp. 511]NDV78402.1 hypothetical protein [Dysgonomonas sp. 511]
MKPDMIIIREYCTQSQIEPDFIFQLEEEGLIELYMEENEPYIHHSQLKEIEQYARWYYDLSINVAGIDVIHNLLDRMEEMQAEIQSMKERLRLFER